MSEIIDKYFVNSFIRFLHKQIDERNFSSDIIESLEVATQCLETAYNITPPATNSGAGAAASTEEPVTTDADLPAKHIDIYELFQNACAQHPANKEEAEQIKNQGNGLMRDEKYHDALKSYNRAIGLDPTNPVFYCNRAAAHSKLGDYQRAADDCKMSLRYDPSYSKAYGRLGIAYSKLNKQQLAVEAYQHAIELEPNNSDYINNLMVAKQKLEESQTQLPNIGLPGGAPFMESIGAILAQPGIRESLQQMVSDPSIQSLVRSITGQMGGAGAGAGLGGLDGGDNTTPDLLASFSQLESQLGNNPNNLFENLTQTLNERLNSGGNTGAPNGNSNNNSSNEDQKPPPAQ